MREVVGVVPDVAQRSFNEVARPHFYQRLGASNYDSALSLVVRTDASPRDLVVPMREAVHGLDPGFRCNQRKRCASGWRSRCGCRA